MIENAETVGSVYDVTESWNELDNIGRGLHRIEKPFFDNGARSIDTKRFLRCVDSARAGILKLPSHIQNLSDLFIIADRSGYLNPKSVIAYAVPYNGERRGGLTPSTSRNY